MYSTSDPYEMKSVKCQLSKSALPLPVFQATTLPNVSSLSRLWCWHGTGQLLKKRQILKKAILINFCFYAQTLLTAKTSPLLEQDRLHLLAEQPTVAGDRLAFFIQGSTVLWGPY